MGLERDIVKRIMSYLRSLPCCFAWKTHGDAYSRSGMPDIIVCLNGRFIALEVKTETGRPTKLQEITIERINSAKGKAYVVRSVGDVKKIIEEVRADDG